MDPVKIGKFIAALRRRAGLTQEALGEKLGVTNKTVSRWETGTYLPGIDALQLLSGEFSVSINELLAGERLSEDVFRAKADENLVALVRESPFLPAERRAFFKRKWRREHIPLLLLLALLPLALWVAGLLLDKPWLIAASPLLALAAYGYQNNRMMAYVEGHLYG